MRTFSIAATVLLAASFSALANSYPEPVSGDFVIHNFKFISGETLPELKIHYRTIGTSRRDARGVVRNAVLLLHGTTGSGKAFLADNFAGVLFGPGQLLDATRYFLILPDGIGHGESSKPSDGKRAGFPRYTYDDMVVAQHRLITEGLHVYHMRLVIGTPMGGMHTWMWGEKYPDFMDALVPLACVPAQIAGRNRMFRKMVSDDIRGDPDWKNGDYAAQPRGLTAALQASRDYVPSPELENIIAPVLAINFADDVVNPPELGLMEKLMPHVKKGRYVLIPAGPETRGHGTHSWPAVWQQDLKALLAQQPSQSAWHSEREASTCSVK